MMSSGLNERNRAEGLSPNAGKDYLAAGEHPSSAAGGLEASRYNHFRLRKYHSIATAVTIMMATAS